MVESPARYTVICLGGNRNDKSRREGSRNPQPLKGSNRAFVIPFCFVDFVVFLVIVLFLYRCFALLIVSGVTINVSDTIVCLSFDALSR
jgi:hypothetical protein